MKKKLINNFKKASKFLILAIFIIITIISNPKPTAFIIINENSNLNKMVDLEKISKINNYKNIQEITAIAEEITEATRVSLDKLSEDMDLGEPTNFTLQQFKIAILSSKFILNDKNELIKSNIECF